MIRRILAALVLLWVAGFLWFAISLPGPANKQKTGAIVVLTGGPGRIDRGLELLREGQSSQMLVSGVDSEVKPHEFAVEFQVSDTLMQCCITLGFAAADTRGNAEETAAWIKERGVDSLRLVTTDWHMRRAALELSAALPGDVMILRDAVQSKPSLRILLLEYHKLLVVFLSHLGLG